MISCIQRDDISYRSDTSIGEKSLEKGMVLICHSPYLKKLKDKTSGKLSSTDVFRFSSFRGKDLHLFDALFTDSRDLFRQDAILRLFMVVCDKYSKSQSLRLCPRFNSTYSVVAGEYHFRVRVY